MSRYSVGTMVRHLNGSGEVHPVRAAREAQGLSPEGLAFKAHVTIRTVERIESGAVKNAHRLTRRAIADALGCSGSDLGWPDLDATETVA